MFIVLESGALNLTHHLTQGEFYETMSSKTAYGVLNNNTQYDPQAVTITTDTECVISLLNSETLSKIKSKDPELYTELILLIMSIYRERFRELLGYSLISM